MPRRANQTSFKPGFDPHTGAPAMTEEQRKLRRKEYYQRHKMATTRGNWERQIRRLGWTPGEYEQALKEQRGVCFICHKADSKKLAADHCHRTGKRRHLLCTRCNTALGLVGDSINILRQMEEYCAEQSGDGGMESREAAQRQQENRQESSESAPSDSYNVV